MARPERLYQGAFDFSTRRKVETGLIYPRSDLVPYSPADEDLGRFVRKLEERVQIQIPLDASRYLMERVFTPFEDMDQEELWVLMMDTKNFITHDSMVYRGTINSAFIRIAEVFKPAIRVNAPSILVSHCHPSGDSFPSPEDVRATEKIVEAGKLLDIEVLDHLVIGNGSYSSMKEKRLGFR